MTKKQKKANSERICGLDEAGRGAVAGPLVAAAVILASPPAKIAHLSETPLKDSKLLKSGQREKLCRALLRTGAEVSLEVISARQINNRGVGWANREIFKRLIRKVTADKYIVDGNLKIKVQGKSERIRSQVAADATIPEVILAGNVAKVERDKIMSDLHKDFRRYHWKINKGYGTKKHLGAIRQYGTCRYHRTVFVTTALKKGEPLPKET